MGSNPAQDRDYEPSHESPSGTNWKAVSRVEYTVGLGELTSS